MKRGGRQSGCDCSERVPITRSLRTGSPHSHFTLTLFYISNITGMIIGRRPVVFWIRRFRSTRTRSFTMP